MFGFSVFKLVLLSFGLCAIAFASPIKVEKRTPANTSGVFVPHPRPGHPGPVITDTDGPVFTPTPTIPGKVLKNPKVSAIRNPKKGP
ncbi:hypothetical protein JCM3766R1_003382 [Sporobolomyces carnicolor]